MGFVPPRCPFDECPSVQAGLPTRTIKRGFLFRRGDARRVQRFQCKHCLRRFSTQSFRANRGLRKPWLDLPIVQLLCAKASMRRIAEILGVRRPTVERRLDRYGSHGWRLQRALLLRHRRLTGGLRSEMVLDELETFEGDRTSCPVTVPVLVEPDSYFVTHVDVAPMAARGGLTAENEARKQRKEKDGPRLSGSDAAVRRSLVAWRAACAEDRRPALISDEKPSYARLFPEVFGEVECHTRVPSTRRRDTRNPLFAVNMTNAMLRDGLGRLVRRTWGHSRSRSRLARHLWLWVIFRNYVRDKSRRQRDRTPASELGVVDRRFSLADVLRWRPPFVGLMFR